MSVQWSLINIYNVLPYTAISNIDNKHIENIKNKLLIIIK